MIMEHNSWIINIYSASWLSQKALPEFSASGNNSLDVPILDAHDLVSCPRLSQAMLSVVMSDVMQLLQIMWGLCMYP